MQKHASNDNSGRYPIVFQHIPADSEATLYYDGRAVELPYSQDFPKLHYHDRYEIGVCTEGDGLFLADGTFASVSRGDYIFIPPGCLHYSRSLDSEKLCSCIFAYVKEEAVRAAINLNGSLVSERVMLLSSHFPKIIRRDEYPEQARMLSGIVDLENRDHPTQGAAAVMRLSLFILEGARSFGDSLPKRQTRQGGSDSVAKIAEYIALRYSDSYTCASLAAICHLSESQLRRRFVSAYGMPPVAYRNSLRSSIAAELLMRTEFSISEISEKLGFTSSSDFYRAFRKQYGVSPSEYRKRKNNPKEE